MVERRYELTDAQRDWIKDMIPWSKTGRPLDADFESLCIDSTSIAHPQSVDALGNPVHFLLTGENIFDASKKCYLVKCFSMSTRVFTELPPAMINPLCPFWSSLIWLLFGFFKMIQIL